MTQEAVTRADLDVDQAKQETRFERAISETTLHFERSMHRTVTEFQQAMHQMERRMYVALAAATGLIIGMMQVN